MLKKIRKAIKKDLGKFYDEFEERFLRSEKKMYKKMNDRLSSLEEKFEKLSEVLLGHLENNEVATPETEPVETNVAETAEVEVETEEEIDVNDLKLLKGLGKGIEKKLQAEGISTLNQLAEMTDDGVKALNEKIAGFEVRFNRYDWRTQAQNFLGIKA